MSMPDPLAAALQRAAARNAKRIAGLERQLAEAVARAEAKALGFVDWDKLHCIFGCQRPVVGVYYLEGGCAVKLDQLQALCLRHKTSAENTGSIDTIVERLEPRRET